MDQYQLPDNLSGLNVTEETKSTVNGLSLWMKINAIVGFTSAAVTLIGMIKTVSLYSRFGFYSAAGMAPLLVSLFSLALSILLNVTLIGAANNLKNAILSADQFALNTGMRKMATYFRIIGIVIICALAISVLIILFSIIFNMGKG